MNMKYLFLALVAAPALAAPVGIKTIVGPNGGIITKIATASISNVGTSDACAVNSGGWIVANNGSRNLTGDCIWDMTGAGFTSAPICTLTPYDNGTATLAAYHKAAPTTTVLHTQTSSNGSAVDISVVNVVCIGD